MNNKKLLFVVSFFTIIGVMLLTIDFDKDKISDIDNSKLYEFDKGASVLEMTKNSENYLEDRIGYRYKMVSL